MIKNEAVIICNLLIKYFNMKKEEVTNYITELKNFDYNSTKKDYVK